MLISVLVVFMTSKDMVIAIISMLLSLVLSVILIILVNTLKYFKK